MTISHGLGDRFEVDALSERPRFGRYGKLAPQAGAPVASQVRAECDRCGSHLLAVRHADGTLDGSCAVCLGRSITAVAAHHATA